MKHIRIRMPITQFPEGHNKTHQDDYFASPLHLSELQDTINNDMPAHAQYYTYQPAQNVQHRAKVQYLHEFFQEISGAHLKYPQSWQESPFLSE